tara:strand:- start:1002 stop:1211 length:210 start_codon:yes stop_codon:yes gene_type:complete
MESPKKKLEVREKKININEEVSRKLDLICFFNQITKKKFVEQLINEYLKHNPLPKELRITKDFVIEVTK